MTSVIIVSFNTKEKLAKCLRHLDPGRHEVIVVDNASSDGSPDLVRESFPQAKLIALDRNIGFGPANNEGAQIAKGDLLLFLNSDAYVEPEAIDRLEAVFGDESIVAAGGMLLNVDGTLQESVAGPLTLWSVFLEQTYLDAVARRFGRGYWRTKQLPMDRPSEVDQVMGACLMMRAKCPERFDERFFLYCEDTELCARLRQHGKILYVPSARITHELGSSSLKNRWLAVARYNAGKELYFSIRQGQMATLMCWLLNRMGAALRLAVGCLLAFRPSGRTKAAIFWRVLWATKAAITPRVDRPR